MRISSLRFKNLNSLAGTWTIDFKVPAYRSGLFAITGPTGAGKSTLLDALCLALYGATPRLGRISAANNEVLTRHKDDCLAEVVFEVNSGCYCARWWEKAKKKGGLNDPKQQLSKLNPDGTFEVLADKINDVREQIGQITGMDFEQFTRTMVLPQGGFAAFLQAKGPQRAELLERLTGAQIYSKLSIFVFERAKSERQGLSVLQERMAEVPVLDESGFQTLQDELLAIDRQERVFREDLTVLESQLDWYSRSDQCELLARETESLQKKLNDDMAVFKPKAERLAAALKAAELDDFWNHVQTCRGQWRDSQSRLEDVSVRLKEVEGEVQSTEVEAHDREKQLSLLQTERDQKTRLFAAVRSLDQNISALNGERQEKERDHRSAVSTRKKLEDEEKCRSEKEAEIRKRLTSVLSERDQGACDRPLLEDFSLIEKRADDWLSALSEAETMADDLSRMEKNIVELNDFHDNCLSTVERVSVQLKEAESALASLRQEAVAHQTEVELPTLLPSLEAKAEKWRECETERERLQVQLDEVKAGLPKLEEQLVLLQSAADAVSVKRQNVADELRLADLGPLRARLIDGKPCPLCGAVHHPFATEPQLPLELKPIESRLAAAEEALKTAQRRLDDGRERRAEAVARQENLGETLAMAREKSQLIAGETVSAFARVNCTLSSAAELAQALDSLKDRCLSIQRQTVALAQAEQCVDETGHQLENAQHAEAMARQRLESQRAMADAEKLDLERLNERIRTVRLTVSERLTAVGEETPDAAGLPALISELRKRRARLATLDDLSAAATDELHAASAALSTVRADLSAAREREQLFHGAIQKNLQQLSAVTDERTRLFGSSDPDVEQRLLDESFHHLQDLEQSARARHVKVQSDQAALSSALAELRSALERQGRECDDAEHQLLSRLTDLGFDNEDRWQNSRMPREECQSLQGEKEDLSRRSADLDSRRHQVEAARAALGKGPEKTRESLHQELDAVSEKLRNYTERGGALKEKLAAEAEARTRRSEIQHQADIQSDLVCRWDNLNGLIGSSKGDKFREYVHGLTLRSLIAQANRQLGQISGRYQLIQCPDDPMELSVVDLYQAGEIRSARNLSGGETFLVSLALALGLSDSSSRLHVDSLFLDEGFGSLDDDALETVLSCLSSLRGRGKLVGVISHVAALQERIDVRISVIPGANGQSRLVGPGCSGEI